MGNTAQSVSSAVRNRLAVCAVMLALAVPVAAQKARPSATVVASPIPQASPATTAKSVNSTPTHLPSPSPTDLLFWKDPYLLSAKGFPWTALAALIAATGAILSVHIKRKSDEKMAKERQEQEKHLAEKRQEQERLHFARKELQDQFLDIQNRLQIETPFVRANAALGLAQFARRMYPEKEIEYQGVTRIRPNESNYPYFKPVTSLLATALYLEPDEAVRHSVEEALQSLISFASVKDGEYSPLLCLLIRTVVGANKAALAAFLQSVASWEAYYLSKGNQPENLTFLAAVTRFCWNSETTEICLRSLLAETEPLDFDGRVKPSAYAIQCQIATARRAAMQEVEQKADDALRLPATVTAARQLCATRDVLAFALQQLPKPNPAQLLPVEYSLSFCFLTGADLRGARMEKLDFYEAHLEGAQCWLAHLEGANLHAAYFEGASLNRANLEKAILNEAHLEGVDVEMACLYGVYLNENSSLADAENDFPLNIFGKADFEPVDEKSRTPDADARTEHLKALLAAQAPTEPPTPQEAL